MKVLVATEKPFAAAAVEGIKKEIEGAGNELVLLEKYTEKAQLLDAVKDVDAMIIRSDKADAEVLDAAKNLKIIVRAGANPKMALHPYTYAWAISATAKYWHNVDPEGIHFTIADTGWGKAVWGKLYGQWIAGANVFVYDHEKFTPAAILEKIQDYHVTSLCAPPTIFRFLIHEDLTKYDLSSLEYCTIAGEALNPAVFETFKKLTGIKLMEGFGQTETTLTVATMPWMEPNPAAWDCPIRNTM